MLNDICPVLDDANVILKHEGKPFFVSSLSCQLQVYLGSRKVIVSPWGHDWPMPSQTSYYANRTQVVDLSHAGSCVLEPFLLFSIV